MSISQREVQIIRETCEGHMTDDELMQFNSLLSFLELSEAKKKEENKHCKNREELDEKWVTKIANDFYSSHSCRGLSKARCIGLAFMVIDTFDNVHIRKRDEEE